MFSFIKGKQGSVTLLFGSPSLLLLTFVVVTWKTTLKASGLIP